MKITYSDYSLPLIEALSPIDQFDNSANKPLLIIGADKQTGEKGEYVVKLNAAERMSSTSSRCNELIAAFMAMELGLSVVTPVVVNVSKNFADLTQGKNYHTTTQTSLGYNVGSSYINKHGVLLPGQELTKNQKEHAYKIFAFDILIQNVDRTFLSGGKPNIITDGEKLVLLDHELAFGFTSPFVLGKNNTPWAFNDADLSWIKKHCLYKKIEHQNVNYSEFLENFSTFNANFWEQANNLLPTEWKSDLIDKIKDHVDLMIKNRSIFAQSLNRLI